MPDPTCPHCNGTGERGTTTIDYADGSDKVAVKARCWHCVGSGKLDNRLQRIALGLNRPLNADDPALLAVIDAMRDRIRSLEDRLAGMEQTA